VKNFHDTLSSECEFTGACITINHTYFVGMLEFAREETLQDYVQALRRQNFFETTRVLSIVENVPKEFLFYFSREATMQSDESQATNEVELNVSEIMKGLVEMARQLSTKRSQNKAKKLFESDNRDIKSKFPNPKKLDVLFNNEDDLFTLGKFCQFLFQPIDYQLI